MGTVSIGLLLAICLGLDFHLQTAQNAMPGPGVVPASSPCTMQELWERGLTDFFSNSQLTGLVRDHGPELVELRNAADRTRHGTRAKIASPVQLPLIASCKPLLEWHEALMPEHVGPLLDLAKRDLQHRLHTAADDQGAFGEASRRVLIDLWKDQIIPMVLFELFNSSDLLKDLKIDFSPETHFCVKVQLDKLISECETGQHQVLSL